MVLGQQQVFDPFTISPFRSCNAGLHKGIFFLPRQHWVSRTRKKGKEGKKKFEGKGGQFDGAPKKYPDGSVCLCCILDFPVYFWIYVLKYFLKLPCAKIHVVVALNTRRRPQLVAQKWNTANGGEFEDNKFFFFLRRSCPEFLNRSRQGPPHSPSSVSRIF